VISTNEQQRLRFAVDKYATPFDGKGGYAIEDEVIEDSDDLTLSELTALVRETGARAVYFNKRYEPEWRKRDARIVSCLRREPLTNAGEGVAGRKKRRPGAGHSGQGKADPNASGLVAIHLSKQSATLLYEPELVATEGFDKNDGWNGHWGTLMPFYKACKSIGSGEPQRPRPPPKTLRSSHSPQQGDETQQSASIASLDLESLELGMALRPQKRKRGRSKRSSSPPRRTSSYNGQRSTDTRGNGKEISEDGGCVNGIEDWGEGIRNAWDIGERAALVKLAVFVGGMCDADGELSYDPSSSVKSESSPKLHKYEASRSRAEPAHECVSRLSPHLMFGEISPRSVHWAVKDAVATGLAKEKTKTFGR
jgi:deoxyribodipyrimidine photolyase